MRLFIVSYILGLVTGMNFTLLGVLLILRKMNIKVQVSKIEEKK